MLGAVIGSYRIIDQLGEGGMGVVYMAEHVMLHSRAVVKVLRPELSNEADILDRFFNEAKAATSIKHPGIVRVFDYGVHAPSGSAFIVMELLDGESLSARLRRGRINLDSAVVMIRQVASALGAAHAIGIVHRDLKPDNIFLVPDPDVPERERAKVLDFGIAKLATSTSLRRTRTGEIFGTPLYMSPEQCQSAADVDLRTDVYALGCIAYEMVTGRCPFDGDGIPQLIAAHMFQQPKPPSNLLPGLPNGVDKAILRALAKEASARQSSLMGFASELEAAAKGHVPTPQLQSPVAAAPGMAPTTTLRGSVGELAAPARGSRPRRTAFLVSGALVVAVATALLLHTATESESATPRVAASDHATTATADADSRPAIVDALIVPADSDVHVATVEAHMRALLIAFVRWSASHAASPCPSLAELRRASAARTGEDAWGHDMKVTCTDQPDDQMVGVISAGPDGVFGTIDDLESWERGIALEDLVRGARWVEAPKPKRILVAPAAPKARGSAATPGPTLPASPVEVPTPTPPPPTTTTVPDPPENKWTHMQHDKKKS